MAKKDNEQENVALFRPEYFDIFGDHLVALMFSQLVYWYSPDAKGDAKISKHRDDKWWLIKSHVDWWNELRMTRKQSTRCLEILREMGLIETRKWMWNGHPTIHIHCTLISGNVLSKAQLSTFHCAVRDIALPQKEQCITESTSENTSKKNLAIDIATEQESNMPTAAEILAAQKAKGQAKPVKVTSSTLGIRWKKLLSADGDYVKELTAKQLGQLKHMVNALGDNALNVLDFAVLNWAKFSWEVKSVKGITSAPTAPDIGFLQQYHDVAVQLIAKGDAKTKTVSVLESIENTIETKAFDSVPLPQDTPEPKATAEDVLATLALLAKLG